MSRRVLITGSRHWEDEAAITAVLDREREELDPEEWLVIIHGGAKGADSIAGAWAYDKCRRGKRVRYEQFTANWQSYGKQAGILRNIQMVHCGADVCHAFPLADSVGTRHCMTAATKAGILVIDHGISVPQGQKG